MLFRLASNFELGDDQPPGNVEKRGEQELGDAYPVFSGWIIINNFSLGSSHNHLFGPPTPAAVKRMRIKKLHEGDPPVERKSKKPLPGISGKYIAQFHSYINSQSSHWKCYWGF